MTETRSPRKTAPGLMLTMRVGEDLHAIPVRAVEEVLPALPIESVPNCPAFVRGVIFVRGHLIPVFDAAERLGLTGHVRPLEPHIVCLQVNDRLIGIEVDEAIEMVDLGADCDLTSETTNFFQALVEREGHFIRVLNPQHLMTADEAAELAMIPSTATRPS